MSLKFSFEVISRTEIPPQASVPSTEKLPSIVLVVDDERVIAETLSVILRKSGFAVLTALDGETALELAEIVPPDLLLSDVMMGPGMDGTQLAIEIVAAFPECKVLLFSGHAATRDLLAKAGEAGHNFTLLSKPLHPADLLARITQSFATEQSLTTA
jgi:CheY-like chemotaxis protein